VDRVEAVHLEEFRFQRPADFDLEEHFAGSFGVFWGEGNVHIKVRFFPPVVRYVSESTWHASQELTPQPDGSLLAQFDLGDTTEIKSWILSFGRYAHVLEPEELRAEMAAEIGQMLAEYTGAEEIESQQ
jgi:proteasome accessory factor B